MLRETRCACKPAGLYAAIAPSLAWDMSRADVRRGTFLIRRATAHQKKAAGRGRVAYERADLRDLQVRAAVDAVGRAQTRDVAGQAVCRRREVAEWRKEGRGNGAATDSSLTQSSWVWDPAQFFHVRYLGSKVVHKAIGSVSGRRKRRVV